MQIGACPILLAIQIVALGKPVPYVSHNPSYICWAGYFGMETFPPICREKWKKLALGLAVGGRKEKVNQGGETGCCQNSEIGKPRNEVVKGKASWWV